MSLCFIIHYCLFDIINQKQTKNISQFTKNYLMSSSNPLSLLPRSDCQITTNSSSRQTKSEQESQQLTENNIINPEEQEMAEDIENNDSQ